MLKNLLLATTFCVATLTAGSFAQASMPTTTDATVANDEVAIVVCGFNIRGIWKCHNEGP